MDLNITDCKVDAWIWSVPSIILYKSPVNTERNVWASRDKCVGIEREVCGHREKGVWASRDKCVDIKKEVARIQDYPHSIEIFPNVKLAIFKFLISSG